MNRLKLSPVSAVTCNDRHEVIENAAIHIEDGRIAYVGPAGSAPEFDGADTCGGEHIVALPGLVNTHTHAAMTLLRGYADDMALEPWLHTRIWPLEAHLSGDDVYLGTMLAAVEMIRGGTTCCADMYHYYEAGTRAFIESGMRACPGGVLLGFLPEAPERIARAIAFAADYRGAGDGRIAPFLAPHSLYTCDRGHWAAMVEGARSIGVPLETHVAETRQEVADVIAQWGATPVQALAEIGALEGHFLGAHCVYLNERDLEIMGAAGAGARPNFHVTHNPTSNLKLASGFAPVPELRRRGICVGVGTDGTASNNDLDMWEEMRLTALLHKATTGDPTAIAAAEALFMATLEGARCLGLGDEIGSLEIGKKADIVLVDFDRPHLTPRHNVVSHLVYAAKAADVCATIVDGRFLFKNGAFVEIDEAKVCHEAQTAAMRLVRAASGAV